MKQPTNPTAERPQGNTIPVQGEEQQRSPRQPHERDESAGSQAADNPATHAMGERAYQDAASGQQDTDRGPVLDQTYDRVREGASQPQKQFRK